MKTRKIIPVMLPVVLIISAFFALTVSAQTITSNETTTASVVSKIPQPSYTVNIPETISVTTTRPLAKYENAQTDRLGNPINLKERFTVSATDVRNLLNGSQLKITIGNLGETFTLTSGTNTIPITLGLKNGETDSEYTLGSEFALFKNDIDLLAGQTNSKDGYIQFNRAKISAGGTYAGTLTFNIAIKGAN
ncbi:MAG: hypothetical protein RR497_05330 [Oscillospiraceae bacterium]